LAVLVLGACLLAQAWWIPLLAFGLMAALTVWAGRTPWPLYARMLLIPVGFLLLGLPAVALSLTAAPVAAGSFQVLGLHVTATQAGLETAGGILARTLGAVSCLYFLALSTPLPDILGLLRRCGIPVLFLEILALVYRFVFVLLDTALDMRRAQSLRLGYTGLRTSYRAWGGGFWRTSWCGPAGEPDLCTRPCPCGGMKAAWRCSILRGG